MQTPSVKLFTDPRVLKISNIRDYQHLIYLCKLIHNITEIFFLKVLESKDNVSQRSIRNKDDFYLPPLSLATSQLTFLYQTPKLWRECPATLCQNQEVLAILQTFSESIFIAPYPAAIVIH